MTEPGRLFVDLEPPAGGLQRLRRSLHMPAPAHRRQAWLPFATGALALGLLVAVLLPSMVPRARGDAALTRALQQAVASRAPTSGVRVDGGAAIELPSGQADAQLYLVQTASAHAH